MNIDTYENGVLVATTPVDVPPAVQNAETIHRQAAQALAANRAFIAKGATNTAADVRAQSIALSRQVNGVIRMLLNQFDGTD